MHGRYPLDLPTVASPGGAQAQEAGGFGGTQSGSESLGVTNTGIFSRPVEGGVQAMGLRLVGFSVHAWLTGPALGWPTITNGITE